MISLNGNVITPTIFPDKTSQVWNLDKKLLSNYHYAGIIWEFESEQELIWIAQLKDLLDSHSIFTSLKIDYLPYGRQDKEVTNETTFALRTFAKILNSLHFNEVKIVDPHSDKALLLIKNSMAIYPKATVEKAVRDTESEIICYPDTGARIKYSKVYDWAYMYGEKVRDPLTGYITKYELIREMGLDIRHKNIMIIDDLCDGGATFILLAKELYAAGAKDVNLFVSHGIFSKGVGVLVDAGIKSIYTKDGEVKT